MKVLLIGDLHIKRNNLADSLSLFERIIQLSEQVDSIIHLGDLYNDHGVMTADVQKIIVDFFSRIPKHKILFNIEGNHDMDGDGINSSLYVHSDQLNINNIREIRYSDQLKSILMPYIRDPREFEEKLAIKLKEYPTTKTVFCHEEFNGAIYENGMYAPNGADSSKFPNIQFISGHIHAEQEFSNVWYAGSPRWLTKSDANQSRGLWILDMEDGVYVDSSFISSEDILPKYHSITINDKDLETISLPDLPAKDKIYITYTGSDPKVIKKIRNKYENLSLKILSPDIFSPQTVSEAKGIVESIQDYVNQIDLPINKTTLLNEIMKRISL